ncbi:MAG: hypothetical protein WC890_08030 [Candidatus Margulisiibacteriota bacterium]
MKNGKLSSLYLVSCVLFVSCFLYLGSLSVEAMGGSAPAKPAVSAGATGPVFLIDNFESGNLKSPRDWWTFDIKTADIASNKSYKGGDTKVANEVGNYSLLFQGTAKNWYAGGAGTYLAKEGQDLSKYSSFQIDIYGNGPGSGTFKIELLDDDNNNWQCEQDPKKSYTPVYDDKFVYDVRVDWTGWKRLVIPFADFVDDNPTVGDDVWNPSQSGASGGLLQVQFICLGGSDKGNINLNVDNVSLSTSKE